MRKEKWKGSSRRSSLDVNFTNSVWRSFSVLKFVFEIFLAKED